MAEHTYLTVPEIADRLKIHQETVRRWLRSGRLQGVMPGGDRAGYRVTEAELRRFLASAPGPATTPPA